MGKNVKFDDEEEIKSNKEPSDIEIEEKKEKEKSVENYLADSDIGQNQNKEETVDKKDKQKQEKQEEQEAEVEMEEEEVIKIKSGELTVLTPDKKQNFTISNEYFVKFLEDGCFLVFFREKEIKNIPVFYIKCKDILSVEEFFDKKPDLANINYFNGRDETEIVLKVNQEELNQWLDNINEQKVKHEDDEDIDDLDYEKTLNYLKVNQKDELIQDIPKRLKNYDYDKFFENEYFSKLANTYDFDSSSKKFKDNPESRFTFYGKFKILRPKVKFNPNKQAILNSAEVSKKKLQFGVIILSKQIPLYSDDVNLNLCRKVTSSKQIEKWQDFNYLYVFDYSKARSGKKQKDDIIPYQFLIDFSEWNKISLLDSNKFAVQIEKGSNDIMVFVFENIIECNKFYNFALKSSVNTQELYKMGRKQIKINVDFCELYHNKLTDLDSKFKKIVKEIFEEAAKSDVKQTFKEFSLQINEFLIGFQGKLTLPPRCVAIFIKVVQNYLFQRILKIVFYEKFQKSKRILELINDIKFHETMLSRWNIFDFKFIKTIKVLQKIYNKMHFNQKAPQLIDYTKDVLSDNYFYYKDRIKTSYLMIKVFSSITGYVEEMKNIKQDKDFKICVIEFTRRCLYLFLINLLFISEDQENKLELKNYPPYLNCLLEIQERIDGMLRMFKDKYKLSNKMLNYFFNRNFLKQFIKKIQDQTIALYQQKLNKDIWEYFKNQYSIEDFKIRNYMQEHLFDKFQLGKLFLPDINYITEGSAIIATLVGFLCFIVEQYEDDDNMDMIEFKKKLGELQETIKDQNYNDNNLKPLVQRMIRAIEVFYQTKNIKDIQKLFPNYANLIYIFDETNKLDYLVRLTKMRKDFPDQRLPEYLIKRLKGGKLKQKTFEIRKKQKPNTYTQCNFNIQYQRIKNLAKELVANKQGDSDEDSDEDEEEEEEEKEDETIDEIIYECRYFPYKPKKIKDYGFIKGKIMKLQFDPQLVIVENGKLIVKNPSKKKNEIKKILQLAQINFLEKFESIHLTIYYKMKMLLVITFNSEGDLTAYLNQLKALIDTYRSATFKLPKIEISERKNIKTDLKELYQYSKELRYVFCYSKLISDPKKFGYFGVQFLQFHGIMEVSEKEYLEKAKYLAELKGQTIDESELLNKRYKVEFKTKKLQKQKKKIVRYKSWDILQTYDFRKLEEDRKRFENFFMQLKIKIQNKNQSIKMQIINQFKWPSISKTTYYQKNAKEMELIKYILYSIKKLLQSMFQKLLKYTIKKLNLRNSNFIER